MLTSLPFDIVEAGRRLGHDLFRYQGPPPRTTAPPSVREGYLHAQSRHLPREPGDRYQRKWLQLRLGACRRGRVIDESVTPALLKRIDVDRCPVTRQRLTHGSLSDSDWSIDRLNNDGGYAPNNLAVMSTRANRAKGERSFAEVLALSRLCEPAAGLAPEEWLRLAALMLGPCFANRPQDAPALPLNAPLPNGSVRLALQQIQHVFTQGATRPAGKNALIKHFKACSADDSTLWRLQALAEKLHSGLKGLDHACDVWLRPGVMQALTDWWGALDPSAKARAGDISRVLAGSTHLPSSRLASWHLPTRGRA